MPVILTYGTNTLRLPSPDFDNVHVLDYDKLNQRTRGGDLIVFRDPAWPKNEIYRLKFSGMDQGKVNKLLLFIKSTLGKIIQYQDHEGNIVNGLIITPAGDVSQPGRDHFSAAFDLLIE